MQKRLLRIAACRSARFIDDVGQVLRQQFERRVDGEAEMAREFLHLGAAENSLELIFGDRKIGAGPEPGFDLGVEPALLQRGDETVEIAVLRLGQHRIDGSGQRRRFDCAQGSSQRAAEIETVQQTHRCLQHKVERPRVEEPPTRSLVE
jgi:hypothetical protein